MLRFQPHFADAHMSLIDLTHLGHQCCETGWSATHGNPSKTIPNDVDETLEQPSRGTTTQSKCTCSHEVNHHVPERGCSCHSVSVNTELGGPVEITTPDLSATNSPGSTSKVARSDSFLPHAILSATAMDELFTSHFVPTSVSLLDHLASANGWADLVLDVQPDLTLPTSHSVIDSFRSHASDSDAYPLSQIGLPGSSLNMPMDALGMAQLRVLRSHYPQFSAPQEDRDCRKKRRDGEVRAEVEITLDAPTFDDPNAGPEMVEGKSKTVRGQRRADARNLCRSRIAALVEFAASAIEAIEKLSKEQRNTLEGDARKKAYRECQAFCSQWQNCKPRGDGLVDWCFGYLGYVTPSAAKGTSGAKGGGGEFGRGENEGQKLDCDKLTFWAWYKYYCRCKCDTASQKRREDFDQEERARRNLMVVLAK